MVLTQRFCVVQDTIAPLRSGFARYAQPVPKFVLRELLVHQMVLPPADLQQEPDDISLAESAVEMAHDAADDVHHQLWILASKTQTHHHNQDGHGAAGTLCVAQIAFQC